MRLNNTDRLIIGLLNINYLGNEFEILREIVIEGLSSAFRIGGNKEVILCYLLGKKFLGNS